MDVLSFKQNGYMILDSQSNFEIESVKELAKSFEGYNKVVFTILINYLRLPQWRTLIFKELTYANLEILNTFIDPEKEYFVRTDTYMEYISNTSYTGKADGVIDYIRRAKEIEQRYILVLEVPRIDIEFQNYASGRTGFMLGTEKQEWVGPGFSEYHLAKDRFPDYCTLHSLVEYDQEGHYEIKWNVSEGKLNKDIEDLLVGIAVHKFKLKDKLFDKDFYTKITNKTFQGKQATQDEVWSAFEAWTERYCKEFEITAEEFRILMKSFAKELLELKTKDAELIQFIKSDRKVWVPSHEIILKTHVYFQNFKSRLRDIGISPDEKILTFAIKRNKGELEFTFWDIHNLNYRELVK